MTNPNGPMLAEDTRRGRLSVTKRVRKWVIGKPKLAATITTAGVVPPRDSSTKVEKPNIPAIIARLALLAVALVVLLTIVTWLLLGFTIMPTVKAGGDFWLVHRAPWTQGSAPAGSTVMVMPESVDRGLLGRTALMLGTDKGNNVMKIVVNPSSPPQSSPDGFLIIDGKQTLMKTQNLPATNGSNYVAKCIVGNCTPGSYRLVPVTNVLGSIVGEVTLTGIQDPPVNN